MVILEAQVTQICSMNILRLITDFNWSANVYVNLCNHLGAAWYALNYVTYILECHVTAPYSNHLTVFTDQWRILVS